MGRQRLGKHVMSPKDQNNWKSICVHEYSLRCLWHSMRETSLELLHCRLTERSVRLTRFISLGARRFSVCRKECFDAYRPNVHNPHHNTQPQPSHQPQSQPPQARNDWGPRFSSLPSGRFCCCIQHPVVVPSSCGRLVVLVVLLHPTK